jgi:uncharacterized membrane protein
MLSRILPISTAFLLLLSACTFTTGTGNSGETPQDPKPPAEIEAPNAPKPPEPEHFQQTELTFKGVGQEPGWSIVLDPLGSFSFKSYDGMEMNTPAVEGIRTGNITTYRASVEMGEMITTLTEEKCQDSMSGKEFPFSVTVMIRRGVEKEFKTYKGCGNFMN